MSPQTEDHDEKHHLNYMIGALFFAGPGSEEGAWVGRAKTGLLRLHHFHFYEFITDLDFTQAFKLLHAAFIKTPLVRESQGTLSEHCFTHWSYEPSAFSPNCFELVSRVKGKFLNELTSQCSQIF